MSLLYFVSGMFCGSCARAIENAVRSLPEVKAAHLNFAHRLLHVELCPPADLQAVDADIVRTVERNGFGISRQREGWLVGFLEQLQQEQARAIPLWLLSLVAFFAMWSSMMALAGYLGELNSAQAWLLSVLSAALGLPALALGVWPFAKSGWRSAVHARTLSLDLVIALGAVSAAGVSVGQLALGSNRSYIDSAAMVLTVLLGAKIVEGRTARRLAAHLLNTAGGQDSLVRRLAPSAQAGVKASQIRKGDTVLFPAGYTILFDGVLLEELAEIDSHLLDGEANPVRVRAGEKIRAGSIAWSPVTLTVEQPLGRREIDLWAEGALASASRPHRFRPLLHRAETLLTAAALGSSSMAGVLCYLRTSDFASSVEAFFLGVLVFCPCLFASILPYSKLLAQLRLRKLGWICHRVDALFDLSDVKAVAFDKTGTLEKVDSTLLCWVPDREPLVRGLLESLRRESQHPILQGLPPGPQQVEVTTKPQLWVTPGQGVVARWPHLGHELVVGRAAFVCRRDVEAAQQDTRTLVALNGELMAEIRSGPSEETAILTFLRELKQRRPQLRLLVLSGDPRPLGEPLRSLAEEGVIEYVGGLSPHQKVDLVPARCLFVGDGLNDTLALTAADVSLRVGTRAKGFGAVDFEVSTASVPRLSELLSFSETFLWVLKQTGAMALVYNLTAWALVAWGAFTPLGAVCAMLLSLGLMGWSISRLLQAPKGRLSSGSAEWGGATRS